MSIKDVAFLKSRFLSSNQINLRSFQKVLIGWKKTALQKSTLFLGM